VAKSTGQQASDGRLDALLQQKEAVGLSRQDILDMLMALAQDESDATIRLNAIKALSNELTAIGKDKGPEEDSGWEDDMAEANNLGDEDDYE